MWNAPYGSWCYIVWRAIWDFHCILSAVQRQDDLDNLVKWTKRKRLSGPRHYYQSLLRDTEMLLIKYTLRHPRTVEAARWCYCLWRMINPRRYQRGYGRKYRLIGG